MPSRKTTYAETQAWPTTYPVRISRYISSAQNTESTAAVVTPGWVVRTIAVASETPTIVPPNRATDRSYVWENSGRITITAAIGAQ